MNAGQGKVQSAVMPSDNMNPRGSLCAEIIAVGTELLMGEVINTNASHLSQQLASLGVDVYYHTAVGDNPARIKGVFKTALSRSNVLLVTGGLGPTDDDLTIATLADLLDTPLVKDEDSETQIKRFFITRDMPMSQTNLKQALRPVDAEPLFNRTGTAPGLFWDVSDKIAELGWGSGPKYILAFPGVPREMTVMWEEVALPMLSGRLPSKSILKTRFLKFIGVGESILGEKLRDLMAQESPTVSPYVGNAEVKIRIAAKAATEAEAEEMIAPVEVDIMARVGEYCYGKDDETLEDVVAKLLKAQKLTLSVAESCTGGLVSARLTDVSGSSEYTRCNVVAYSYQSKETVLGVSKASLETYGAVSEEVAKEMADGLLRFSGTDVAVSLTGIAGPTGATEEKPLGLVYIAIAQNNAPTTVKKVLINPQYSRQQIKFWFSQYALNFLRLRLGS
jgi:nicotinamide-nucleotide amidase